MDRNNSPLSNLLQLTMKIYRATYNGQEVSLTSDPHQAERLSVNFPNIHIEEFISLDHHNFIVDRIKQLLDQVDIELEKLK